MCILSRVAVGLLEPCSRCIDYRVGFILAWLVLSARVDFRQKRSSSPSSSLCLLCETDIMDDDDEILLALAEALGQLVPAVGGPVHAALLLQRYFVFPGLFRERLDVWTVDGVI